MEPASARPDAGRRIRSAVTAVYYAVVGSFIVICLINVVGQLWPASGPSPGPVDCRSGLYDLARAIERARSAASASLSDDETEALARFRTSLDPEWQRHGAIAASCRRAPAWASSLDVIERLRYAEERAVRRDVTELSPLRRKVDQLLETRLRGDP